jgi:hypothetical protein
MMMIKWYYFFFDPPISRLYGFPPESIYARNIKAGMIKNIWRETNDKISETIAIKMSCLFQNGVGSGSLIYNNNNKNNIIIRYHHLSIQ